MKKLKDKGYKFKMKCEVCGETFPAVSIAKKYCSKECCYIATRHKRKTTIGWLRNGNKLQKL